MSNVKDDAFAKDQLDVDQNKTPSVSRIVLRSTILGFLFQGLVALGVGLGMYSLALYYQYVNLSYDLAHTASVALDEHSDVIESITQRVSQRYYQMNDEQLSEVNSEAYRQKFYDIYAEDEYQKLHKILGKFLASTDDLFDIYIGFYDPKRTALVYIVDPDPNPETAVYPGDWESVDPEEVQKYVSWKEEDRINHVSNTEQWGWISTSGYPIRNASGKVVAFVLADVTLREFSSGIKYFIIYFTLAIVLVTVLLGFLFFVNFKRKIVQPINKIAQAALSYAEAKRKRENVENNLTNTKDQENTLVEQIEHFANLNITNGKELIELGSIMAKMEHYIKDYEDHLTSMTAEKERIETELSLATRIQADMLPNEYPAFPDRDDFDIYASMFPAKEVGGDFYDYFLLDSSHLVMMIADVSGKGVPAALFMMMAKLLLKNAALEGMSPANTLTEVNEAICRNNKEEMFVTVWFGILDLATGVLTAANAGHEFPILKNSKGKFETVKDKHDFVLGGMQGIKYRQYELHLEPGSCLFLYTDGVAEATSKNLNLFGIDELVATLNLSPKVDPKHICEEVHAQVDKFVGDAPQFDDITMMCISYIKKYEIKESDMPTRDVTVKSTIDQLEVVTSMINSFLDLYDCPKRTKHQICVVIDELFSNIANYAYDPAVGDVHVAVRYLANPAAIEITFTDFGQQFNPVQSVDPDISLPAEARDAGGLGIMMVKKLMDGIRYEYKNEQNILTVKKFLS